MGLNFTAMVRSTLRTVFGLGGEWIRAAVFVRPIGFNAATGLTSSAEISAGCWILCLDYRPMDLGWTMVQPGQEKILIRAAELSGVTEPGTGDRIVEVTSGLTRRVVGSRQDMTGEFWIFQTERTPDEDWGDLTAATASEDRGALDAVTALEDWGGLNA